MRTTSVATGSRVARAVGSALLLGTVLCGCGQKGPLTLPKPLPAASAPAP